MWLFIRIFCTFLFGTDGHFLVSQFVLHSMELVFKITFDFSPFFRLTFEFSRLPRICNKSNRNFIEEILIFTNMIIRTFTHQSRFAVRNSKKKFLTSYWLNRGPLKILNGIKLILDDQGNHLDSYTISLESFRSFRGPLFRKPVTS